MKIRKVKMFMMAAIAGSLVFGSSAGVLAAEASKDESVQGSTEDVQEAGTADASYIYGQWSTQDLVRMIFEPDGYVYEANGRKEGPYCAYRVEGDKIIFDVDTVPPEDLEGLTDPSLEAELQDVDADFLSELGDKFSDTGYHVEEGVDKIMKLTVTSTDESDPLSPKTVQDTAYVCKNTSIDDYLLLLLGNKSWEWDGKILTMEDKGSILELDLSLDDGAQTGKVRISLEGAVSFAWDTGNTVKYTYVSADADSVTLASEEDPSQTFVLNRVDETAEDSQE